MIVLVGESACGKSSVQNELVDNWGYKKVITYTTRPKRDYEVAGKDYHFISEEEFLQLKESNYFLETACYNGWYYGTAKKDCEVTIDDFSSGYAYEDNKVIVLTPHGLRNLQKYANTNDGVEITAFYIKVPRRDRLIKILERNDNVDEAIRRNMSDVGQFDGIEDEVDYIIVNDGYKTSIWEMANIIHNLYI